MRDRLLETDDWVKAADAYASERDHYYRLLHRAVVWSTELLYDPGPEADAALRDALGKLKGRSLVGVVNSLGVRKDAKAVPARINAYTEPSAVSFLPLAVASRPLPLHQPVTAGEVMGKFQ